MDHLDAKSLRGAFRLARRRDADPAFAKRNRVDHEIASPLLGSQGQY
jgi:hypothetical protein